MKDGVIVQIGTPEDIVMKPADDYVREFVQGISKLKLVKARSIMLPLALCKVALDDAPRIDGEADLDTLIQTAIETEHLLVITENGQDAGYVDKTRLLAGIGGKIVP